jgi:integrase
VRLYFNGVRFLYLQVLHWPQLDLSVALPKRPQRIPELLTPDEVGRILAACDRPDQRMMLTLCYGCGLRLNELRHLKVGDIDGKGMRLRIEQAKGAKDRLVALSTTLLSQLRAYWRLYQPKDWLFPGQKPGEPVCETLIQRAFQKAKRKAGIGKHGGIHSLRHAYATHQLEAGMAPHRLQRLMGHSALSTTVRYVHWLPDPGEGEGGHDLVGRLGISP